MKSPQISILICSVLSPHRDSYYIERLLRLLEPQLTPEVQLIIETDDMSMKVGDKRNLLMSKADGERLIFVDDDDRVSTDYVESLLSYCKKHPEKDCITIGVEYTQEGGNKKIYDYHFRKNINFRKGHVAYAGRVPNHLCLWKTHVARRVQFPSINLSEDHNWADQQVLKGYSVAYEEKVIYYYDFHRDNSLTRHKR